MAELLIELLSEEIPARMQARAVEDFKRLVCNGLEDAQLSYNIAEAYVTPRRLTLVVDGLPLRQPDRTEERKGPRVGAPEQAIKGFLRGASLGSLEQAEIRETPKGEFYFAVKSISGSETTSVLAGLVADALASIPWPKSMRWAGGTFSYVRPLHNVLCVFDAEAIALTVKLGSSDAADLTANNATRGHRFLAPEEFEVSDFTDYRAKLKAAKVILDRDERKRIIQESAAALAAGEGLSVRDNPGLLEEVAGLVEWPVVLMGRVDDAFMDVPPEVLITAMRQHQKYFTVLNTDGTMAPRFIVVANMETADGGEAIVAGNERVLRARLSDAKFFWDQDRKRSLQSRVEKLSERVFHARLGSDFARVERLRRLARALAPFTGADADQAERAALLAKADLTTGMVGEFPELQGVMGRYYALNDGEDAAVADAIAQHYAPQGPNDACPSQPVAVAVALADKIDSLVGFFAIGERPTGSGDPFALRRAALGVIRLIIENGIRLDLHRAFAAAYLNYLEQVDDETIEVLANASHEIGLDTGKLKKILVGTVLERFFAFGGTLHTVFDLLKAHPKADFSDPKLTKAFQHIQERAYLLRGLAEQREKAAGGTIPEPEDNGLDLAGPYDGFLFAERVGGLLASELLDFFADRLKVHLRDRGVRHDLVSAVFAVAGETDLVRLLARVEALKVFVDSDDGANLLVAYRRASNIVRIEEKRDQTVYRGEAEDKLFAQQEESNLHSALVSARDRVRAALTKERFAEAMAALADLRAPVDAFFDTVTVNCDDPRLRVNRLKLLAQIRSALEGVADFSHIEA